MGNRLSKIYTRTGDTGSTGLGDGSRISKDSARIEAIGDVDELNCTVGMVLALPLRPSINQVLTEVQHKLFDLGSELSVPGWQRMEAGDIEWLEQTLDEFNAELPALKEFILPGGGPASAACHLARAVCRRAERRVITLAQAETLNPNAQRYLNRLSDLLFVLCRVLARDEGGSEVLWRNQRQRRPARTTPEQTEE